MTTVATGDPMAIPICPACCDYFERDGSGRCSNCGANFRITLRFDPVGTSPLASHRTVGDRQVGDGLVGAVATLDDSRTTLPCPTCGTPAHLGEGVCYRCGQRIPDL